MEKRFIDKVVLITGAAGFIGSRIARRFAAEGAKIVLCDCNLALAQKLADELSASGSETLALEVDVKKSSDAHMAVNKAVERFGRLDQLVCVAGGSTREKMCYFVDQDEDVMLDNIGVNFFGAFFFAHAAIQQMDRQKSGNIIFIASVLGTQGQRGCVEYSASKGAVIAMCKALSMEAGEFGVRVNCVSPALSSAARSSSATAITLAATVQARKSPTSSPSSLRMKRASSQDRTIPSTAAGAAASRKV